MTTYLAVLGDNLLINVSKVPCDAHLDENHFWVTSQYVDGDGKTYKRGQLVNLNHITREQFEFEGLHRKFTLRGDYSKYDSLIYRCTLMQAAYITWRIAKGLPVDDIEYKAINGLGFISSQSNIYPENRGKWVGD